MTSIITTFKQSYKSTAFKNCPITVLGAKNDNMQFFNIIRFDFSKILTCSLFSFHIYFVY